MITKNTATKYKLSTTAQQYRFLCGVLLPEIQRVQGVDRETAHKRMRKRLIEWGYIKKSRSELSYHQTIEITQRYKNYLNKHGLRFNKGEVVEPLSAKNQNKSYAESGVCKTL